MLAVAPIDEYKIVHSPMRSWGEERGQAVKDLVVVGQHLTADYPTLIDELRDLFDVQVLDFMQLGDTVDAIAGRTIKFVVTRIEYLEFFAAVTTMLAPTGTSVSHCLAWGHSRSEWSDSDLAQLGLCGCLDMSLTIEDLVAQLVEVCGSCPRHPETLFTEHIDVLAGGKDGMSLSTMDDTIANLVVRGLSDRTIADMVHYSNQTIRNKVSRILKDYGFDNRTELATAQLRHSFRTYLGKSPDRDNSYGASED